MNYVIGSGPAGVSAAFALLEKGEPVTLLDCGISVESGISEKINLMSDSDASSWDPAFIQEMKFSMKANASGVPLKTLYGSDFPYRLPDSIPPIASNNSEVAASFARGGLSNVWGASILPYIDADITDWPIAASDLAPHYRKVLSFMDLAGCRDGLDEKFPLYTDTPVKVRASKQAEALLSDLEKSQRLLTLDGISFGHSRIGLRRSNRKGMSCVYCGLCMYGCPYDLIYNASQTLDKLRSYPNFRYVSGILVDHFHEEKDSVSIHAIEIGTGRSVNFSAARLFIGAGLFSTARIVLKAQREYETEITAKDSQYFLFPIIRWKGSQEVDKERLHTLAQAYIGIDDRRIAPNYIHLQVYTFNELYSDALKSMTGLFLFSLIKPLVNWFLSRLLIVQGYLHSDSSPTLSLRLESGSTDILHVRSKENAISRPTIRKVIKKLSRLHRLFRGIPIQPMLKIPPPGRGFHSGGTFPMRKNPGKLETDILGRPAGLARVHIVDSSVLPSIPATTITFSVMANAHRIATDAVGSEP